MSGAVSHCQRTAPDLPQPKTRDNTQEAIDHYFLGAGDALGHFTRRRASYVHLRNPWEKGLFLPCPAFHQLDYSVRQNPETSLSSNTTLCSSR
jgi:hypothetical protein